MAQRPLILSNGKKKDTQLLAEDLNFDDTIYGSGVSSAQELLDYIKQKLLYRDFARKTTGNATESTSFQQFLRLQATIPEDGNYKISWHYSWSLDTSSNDFFARVQVDDSITLMEQIQEPNDSVGRGVTLSAPEGGTLNTGTNQRLPTGGCDVVALTSGVHNIDLDWHASGGVLFGNNPAAVYKGVITIERWN